MPDISMCSGLNCPLAEKCYRKMAKPGSRQSFFVTPPYDHSINKCAYFAPIYVLSKRVIIRNQG